MKALVVGGTGPTGPFVVDGLLTRGYEVALFHRGTHEVAGQEALEHIHGDPHFPATIEEALGDRRWDLVVAMYGRIRHVATAVAGRCDRFVGVGGIMAYRGFTDPLSLTPPGMPIEALETTELATDIGDEASQATRFANAIVRTEHAVMELAAAGAFSATYFRYPQIYGARVIAPAEWSVVRRIRDGREFMVLPDHGLAIKTRCAAPNAAHAILLAVDRPAESDGETFNVRDDLQFTFRQWLQIVSRLAGRELRMLSLPCAVAWPAWGIALSKGDDHHDLVSNEKLKRVLGYSDVIDPHDGLGNAVDWLSKREPDPERFRGRDHFDYDGEDELVDAYERALSTVPANSPNVQRSHSYPHPTVPGTAVDHRGR